MTIVSSNQDTAVEDGSGGPPALELGLEGAVVVPFNAWTHWIAVLSEACELDADSCLKSVTTGQMLSNAIR